MSKTFPLFGLFLKVKNLGRDPEFELLTYFKNISEALRFCVLTNNDFSGTIQWVITASVA
jgi:hypothetical protein